MKNIHILPTDKPSRLHLAYDKFYYLSLEPFIQLDTKNYKSFNIYITSDEEIKEGDWYINRLEAVKKCELVKDNILLGKKQSIGAKDVKGYGKWSSQSDSSKIILTTDPDLIKDGVQAIDDEFLEWFVKNPSCEYVEVIPLRKSSGYYDDEEVWHWDFLAYKIIILQEKPKQFSINSDLYENNGIVIPELPKQETLEEAAERYADFSNDFIPMSFSSTGKYNETSKRDFIAGAKWQAERSYTYDEVRAIAYKAYCIGQLDEPTEGKFNQWINQFNKK
jgi:hypothetical protein